MILFRTNASATLGFGHITRCRALAALLKREGENCVLVGPDLRHALADDFLLFDDWVPSPEDLSAEEDASNVISLARVFQAKWLVLDDYRVDGSYQRLIRSAGIPWLQFDTRGDKQILANLVINASPSARIEKYKEVLGDSACELFLGPRYALLRPEFRDILPRRPGRPIKRILVTFGGGDDCGAIRFVVSELLPSLNSDQEIHVVSGEHNPGNGRLKEWFDKIGSSRVKLWVQPEQIAKLYQACDLAVMAGGTSTFEAAICGLPMILVSIADNQRAQSEAWAAVRGAVYLGSLGELDATALVSAFESLNGNFETRELMSSNLLSLGIGSGVSELVARLVDDEITR